jgi:hypothetical protein
MKKSNFKVIPFLKKTKKVCLIIFFVFLKLVNRGYSMEFILFYVCLAINA